MKHKLLLTSLLCLALGSASVHAANKYWDINVATPGAGGPAPAGTWNTSVANWSTDSTGSSATTTFTSGTTDTATFSAGTDATGEFTVNLPSALTAGAVTNQEGIVDLTGSALTAQTIAINSGATLSYVSSGAIVAAAGGKIFISGGTFRCMNTGVGGTFLTANMGIVLGAGGGTLSVDGATTAISIYAASISGTGPLTKAGVGTFRLTTTVATYSGATIIAGGTLQISTTANVLPSATDVTINSGAILNVQNTLRIGSVTGAGNITMTSVTLTIGGSTSPADFTGVISDGTSFGNITKTGTGTLTLSGANTYDGTFTLSQGTCTVTASGSLCGPACDVSIAGGVLNLNNAAQTIENFNGSASTVNLGTGHTLTSLPAGSATYSGTMAGNGAFAYSGGLYTQTLSGNNSYSGGTTLSGGTLIMSGNNTANGPTIVNAGLLKISGSNTGTGATTVNAGTLLGVVGGSMANSVVTVNGGVNSVQVTDITKQWTCAGLTYGGGVTYLDFDFRSVPVPSTTLAPLQVNGDVDFSLGPPTVSIDFSNPPAGPANYPLITWTGNQLGTPPTEANLGPHSGASLTIVGKTLYLSFAGSNGEPLFWAKGGIEAWDIATSFNWLDANNASTTYQEIPPQPGDWVVFEDSKSGASPIEVTMNTTVNPYTVVVSNITKEYKFSGSTGIAGTGGGGATPVLTKQGSNKLTLANQNSYTGPTLVQQGTLQIGDGVVNGAVQSIVTVNSGASLVFSNASDQVHPADIRGAGTLTKGSAGQLQLNAGPINDISGGQNVYDGTLFLNNIANMMKGPILVNGPSARLLVTSYAAVGNNGAAGVGDITLNNGGTYENNANAVITFLSVNRKIMVGANGGRIALTGGDPGTCIALFAGTMAGVTAGTGTLTYDGPGELRCYTGVNSFGKLIVNTGRFTAGQATTAGSDTTFGAVPATLTPDAITIRNGSALRWGGSATATLNANRGITIGSGGGIITVVPGATLTIAGPITGSGALQLNFSFDNGFLVLSNANTFSGGVTIMNGTNCINSTTALGAAASTVFIGGAAGIAPQLRNTSGGAITLINNNPQTWQTDFSFQGTSDLNLGTGAVTLSPLSGSVINLTNTANTLTVGGIISGPTIALTKAGGGTLRLNAINAYTGDTTISAGTLQLGDGTASNGNVAGNIVDNATLIFANPTALTYSGVISGTGTLTKQAAGVLTVSGGPNTDSGVTTISAGTLKLGNDDVLSDTSPVVLSTNDVVLDMNNFKDTIGALSGSGSVINNTSTTLTLAADANTGTLFQNYSCIYGPFSSGSLAKSGTHTLALRETNTFTVPVTLNAGTLSVGVISNEMPATTAMNIPAGATFQLDGTYQTVSALTGAGTVNLGGTLAVTQANATSSTFSGLIQDSGVAGSSSAVGHGLRGYYYDNADFTSLLAVRDDATINFTDLTSAAQLPAALYANSGGTNNDSARWIGKLLSTAAGTYIFTTACDDGRRLWINGQLVIDGWVPGNLTKTGTNVLAANTMYDILMEWYNGTGGANAKLSWTPPGDSTATIIASNYLFLPSPGQLVKNGLGTLTLDTGANTYSGGTVVNAGLLDAQVPLGVGSVTVASGATLKVSVANAISSTGDLILRGASPVVQLALSGGTDNIHGLSFDGGATWQSTGLYGPIGSGGGATEDGRFTGSGFVQVTAGPVTGNVLVSSLNPAAYGSTITYTATVTGAGPTPTGTVTFYDAASAIGMAALSSGVATLTVNKLSVAGSAHSITAVYNGDPSYTRKTSSAVSQVVNPATLVPTATVAGKVYDGTTSATVATFTVAGIIPGDEASVGTNAVAAFGDKNVGPSKAATVTVSLTGSLAGNYTLSPSVINTTGAITAKPITVTAVTDTKNYDGNTTSIGVPTITLGGPLAIGDSVTWTQTFDSANASLPNGRTLTPVGNVNDGNGGNNYNVTRTTAVGTITPVCSATNLLLGITNNGNATFSMGFQGTFQAQYYVKTSTNAAALMTTWVPLAGSTNIITNASGLWNLTVPTSGAVRFYRSVADKLCP